MAPALLVTGVDCSMTSIRSPGALDKHGGDLPESARWLGDRTCSAAIIDRRVFT
jgi:hypothetical protein